MIVLLGNGEHVLVWIRLVRLRIVELHSELGNLGDSIASLHLLLNRLHARQILMQIPTELACIFRDVLDVFVDAVMHAFGAIVLNMGDIDAELFLRNVLRMLTKVNGIKHSQCQILLAPRGGHHGQMLTII